MITKSESRLKQFEITDGFEGVILFEFFNDNVSIFQTSNNPTVEEKFNRVDESVDLHIDDFVEAIETILNHAKERRN